MSLGDEMLVTELGHASDRVVELSGPLHEDGAARTQALARTDFTSKQAMD